MQLQGIVHLIVFFFVFYKLNIALSISEKNLSMLRNEEFQLP